LLKIPRPFLLCAALLLPVSAPGLTVYRVELVCGGVVFAENQPKVSGSTYVFRSAPQGNLVSLRRSEVARVEAVETLNRPPLDLGRATVKEAGAPGVPVVPAKVEPRPGGVRWAEARAAAAAKGMRPGYAPGDDQPGRTVAFPVSRDDLLPGNYRPFPAAPGGQSGPAPTMAEGQGVPKAGSLQEPVKVIQLPNAPASANMQLPAPPLVYSDKPHVDGKLGQTEPDSSKKKSTPATPE
jgi:hypothetical protein